MDLGRYYAILPSGGSYTLADYCAHTGARAVPAGFAYDSGRNTDFLSVSQLQDLITQHVVRQQVD